MNAILFNIQKFCLHDGPGIRTTVFFKGCNLRCRWCANPESQSRKLRPELSERLRGRVWTLEEVLREVLRDKPFYEESGGGVTFSGGEPLLQADFVRALAGALRGEGVATSIETAAAVPPALFEKVFPLLDSAHIDLKHYDEEKHRAGTGVGLAHVLANLKTALASSTPVNVRIPIIPGYNDAPDDARAFANLLRELGAKSVQILPFHQMGEKKYEELGRDYPLRGVPPLHEEDLSEYAAILGGGELAVQIGG